MIAIICKNKSVFEEYVERNRLNPKECTHVWSIDKARGRIFTERITLLDAYHPNGVERLKEIEQYIDSHIEVLP